jgi:hypothetical protein
MSFRKWGESQLPLDLPFDGSPNTIRAFFAWRDTACFVTPCRRAMSACVPLPDKTCAKTAHRIRKLFPKKTSLRESVNNFSSGDFFIAFFFGMGGCLISVKAISRRRRVRWPGLAAFE